MRVIVTKPVPSPEHEQSYIWVRGIVTKPVPSQKSERSYMWVRGIVTKPVISQESERSYICGIFERFEQYGILNCSDSVLF